MYKTHNSNKNPLLLLVILLAGIVIGGFLGELAQSLSESVSALSFLSWLNYGMEFGLDTPINLDLHIIRLTFGAMFRLSICGILGLIAAIFIYRKL